ncbi:peptidoglycan-binding protein [Paractinoplanes rhizophilus]|uniref:Peptidoglycan-binding protein n=1 Tax=Paractinoplanes rhizophilus TaxID=1416877 RepID=A0ABW2HYS5_9ACTN|nr:peptidoglycan-binding domain-containing protein [Actinoplanes sp.]
MSARGMLSVVGTAVGGLIGWPEQPPPAEPEVVRSLLAEVGMPVGEGESLELMVRAFQERVGLEPDGVAGPRTVHLLARYSAEIRARNLGMAA